MIYRAKKEDAYALAELAVLMWAENTAEELAEEFAELMDCKEAAVFILALDNQPAGFAQCQLRHDYVEGTKSSPVGYLEGIFVKPEYRKQGYAKALLQECEKWALRQGCSEFASDCELTNEESLAFHLKVGFIEANRIICFQKRL